MLVLRKAALVSASCLLFLSADIPTNWAAIGHPINPGGTRLDDAIRQTIVWRMENPWFGIADLRWIWIKSYKEDWNAVFKDINNRYKLRCAMENNAYSCYVFIYNNNSYSRLRLGDGDRLVIGFIFNDSNKNSKITDFSVTLLNNGFDL